MKDLENAKLLPDPNMYKEDYFQFMVPGKDEIDISLESIPEWSYITYKVATYKKVDYVEANGARSKRWLLISYQ